MIPDNIQAHIDDLWKEADALQSEADSIREKADACREAAKLLSQKFGGKPAATTKRSALSAWKPPEPHKPTRRRAGKKPKTRADWAELVLRESGTPMRIPEMIDAFTAKGHGTNMKRNILYNSTTSALTRRPDRFRKVGDGTWALADHGNGKQETTEK